MNNDIFQDCLNCWENSTGNTRFWPELADKHGYENGEILRSVFKRERKKRGIYKEENIVVRNLKNLPNIGIMDIEMLPASGYFWQLYDQNISLNQLISDNLLLSWAGKLINSSQIMGDILTRKEVKKRDAERITISAYNFIENCEILVGHNFRSFDFKLLNSHFLLYGLKPIRRTIIDTLEIAKQNFRFTSNKLAFINEKLGIRNKIDNSGFPLWVACSRAEQSALDEMFKYNLGDVNASEELFFKLRSFMPNHPNLALYNEIDKYQCPCCLSQDLSSEGFYYSGSAKYESVRCDNCGSLSRKKENLLSKDKRKSLLARL